MKCFFTDLEVESNSSSFDFIEYRVKVDDKHYYLKFGNRSEDWVDDFTFEKMKLGYNIDGIETAVDGEKLIPKAISDVKYIIRSLILNNKWNTENYDYLINKNLRELIKNYYYPKIT